MATSATRRSIVIGLLAGALVTGLIGYWFGVADRHAVFLYEHVDQPCHAPLGPFHRLTIGRYWMTGFVAGGIVAAIYLPGMVLAGWWARRHGGIAPEPRPGVSWLAATAIIVVAVPALTMTVNQPTMPARIAAMVTVACVAALGLALSFGRRAASRPRALFRELAMGVGLVPLLTTWRAIELPARGIFTVPQALCIAAGGAVLTAGWLLLARRWFIRQRMPSPSWRNVVWAGLACHAIGHPLAHYLLATPPGFPYITTARNVFADSPVVWLSGLAAASVLAWRVSEAPRPGTKAR